MNRIEEALGAASSGGSEVRSPSSPPIAANCTVSSTSGLGFRFGVAKTRRAAKVRLTSPKNHTAKAVTTPTQASPETTPMSAALEEAETWTAPHEAVHDGEAVFEGVLVGVFEGVFDGVFEEVLVMGVIKNVLDDVKVGVTLGVPVSDADGKTQEIATFPP